MLQAGRPDNDVLLYWPIHDYWMQPEGTKLQMTVHGKAWMDSQPIGRAAAVLMKNGYAFDFISDRLLQGLALREGKLRAIGGSYRAIVVPVCRHIPVKTLGKLADLAEQGAVVIFEKEIPGDVPGWGRLEERRKQLAGVRERLQKLNPRVAGDLVVSLASTRVPREPMADVGLKFIRRRVGEDVYYFLANQTAKAYDGWMALSRPFAGAVLFDPMTGASGRLAVRQRDDASEVYLQISPGESRILRLSPKPARVKPWTYLRPKGDSIAVEGPWEVEFIQGEPKLPASYKTEKAASWTEAPDEEAKRFAGTASYKTTIDLSADVQADDWLLELGDVRESARVRVNGQEAGAVIALPKRLRVGPLLRKGTNTLEIEVTNLSANRIRDVDRRGVDWKIMKDINIVTVHYRPITPAKWPVEPSGLLGPVGLVPMARLDPMHP